MGRGAFEEQWISHKYGAGEDAGMILVATLESVGNLEDANGVMLLYAM